MGATSISPDYSAAARLGGHDVIPDSAVSEPKEDAFRHDAIAARVTDLVTQGEPPFNVALFGPWGSGKSSLAHLIQAQIADRFSDRSKPRPRLIIYNAWKLGGEGLHRNFITHAANDLKLTDERRRYRQFQRGLYQNRRTVDINSSSLAKGILLALVLSAAFFVAFAALAALLLGSASIFTEEDFFGQMDETLPEVLLKAGPFAFVAAVVALGLRSASVEIDQSAPAEAEEFSGRFRRLVEEARSRHSQERLKNWLPKFIRTSGERADRLVFFVDELDRCSAEDVVATLVAIRAFLDEEHCVFIVAADRDVLERALKKAKQPTPTNEVTPYYSSASAFLDKIFQHQLALPPLRGHRLGGFARDLVDGQINAANQEASLWRELRADQETFDDTLYALVPSHVRSPRRIKVLLNHFAVTARVAQSRGIEWPARGPEIAKLVAMRTEFPNFAADLFQEPRLPSLMVAQDEETAEDKDAYEELEDADEESPDGHDETAEEKEAELPAEDRDDEAGALGRPARVERLLNRHRHEVAPDEYIDGAPDPEVARQHREQLRRYLERTSDIDDPRGDLLFLEPGGQIYGLDAELSERIERDAPDVPEEVLGELLTTDIDTQQNAALFLADRVQELDGRERARVMTVLMGLVERLDGLEKIAWNIAKALTTYRTANQLDEQHLVGALRVALEVASDTSVSPPLVSRLFSDQRLLKAPERVQIIAGMANRLHKEELQDVQAAIGQFVADDAQVLLAPIRELDERDAVSLIDSTPVWDGIHDYVAFQAAEDASEFLGALQRLGLSEPAAPELAFVIQGRLLMLNTGLAYQQVQEHADQVLTPDRSNDEVNLRVLQAWRQAPPEHWQDWSDRFRD